MSSDFKTLPIIDVAPLLEKIDDPKMAEDPNVAEVIRQLDKACRETGFFYVKGHGVPDHIAKEVLDVTRDFFHLPFEEKLRIKMSSSTGHRGYQKVGENVTKGQPDMHEAIDCYREIEPGSYGALGKALEGANLCQYGQGYAMVFHERIFLWHRVPLADLMHWELAVEAAANILQKALPLGSNYLGIFCLPASAVIPFHNHPGMTVLSKLLFGSMYIKAYDWVDSDPIITETNSNQSQLRLAKLEVDNVFTSPCDTSVLYPTSGGNIHSFRAVTSCAVLDVLGPPYSDIEGRNCTYYREYPYSSLPDNGNAIPDDDDDQGFTWLEEIEKPDDFIVRGAPYKGPQI